MPTTNEMLDRELLDIAGPCVPAVVLGGSWAIGTGMCLFVTDGGFWVCVAIGFFFCIILSLPMVVLLALALWAVDVVVGTVEVIRDEICWRRVERQGRR